MQEMTMAGSLTMEPMIMLQTRLQPDYQRRIQRSRQLTIGNHKALNITHTGNIFLPTLVPSRKKVLKITLHVLATTKNLISISKLNADNNVTIEFNGNLCFVKDKKGEDFCFKEQLRMDCSSLLI